MYIYIIFHYKAHNTDQNNSILSEIKHGNSPKCFFK